MSKANNNAERSGRSSLLCKDLKATYCVKPEGGGQEGSHLLAMKLDSLKYITCLCYNTE